MSIVKQKYEHIKVEIDQLNRSHVNLQDTRFYLSLLQDYIEILLFGVDEDIRREEKENDDRD